MEPPDCHGHAGSGQLQSVTSAKIPLGELADIKFARGPTVIKSEEGLLTAYVYIDFRPGCGRLRE